MEALRSVLAKLGFEIDTKELTQGNKKFDSFLKQIAGGWATFRAGKGAMSFLEGQAKIGSDLEFLAAQLGFTTQALQKYKYAAEQTGLTTQQFTTAMKIMQNHLGGTQTLTGMAHGIKVFGQFGINTKKAAGGGLKELPEMIGQVADKMTTFKDAAMKVRFANEMFGEMGFRLIPLLSLGSEGVKELFKDFDKLNLSMYSDFSKSSVVVRQKIHMMKTAFQVFKSELAFGAYPWVKRVVGALAQASSYMTGLSRRTTLATTIWVAFGAALLYQVVRLAGGFRMLLMWMGRLAWPLLLAGLLYLVFDDLFNLMEGNRSLIGTLLDEFLGAGTSTEVAKELKVAWENIKQTLEDTAPAIKLLLKLFGQMVKEVLPFVLSSFTFLVKLVAFLVSGLGAMIAGPLKFITTFVENKTRGKGWGEAFDMADKAAGQDMQKMMKDVTSDKFWRDQQGVGMLPWVSNDLSKGGGGGGTTTIINEVTVEGVVTNQEDMKKTVEKAVKRTNSMPANTKAMRQAGYEPAGR